MSGQLDLVLPKFLILKGDLEAVRTGCSDDAVPLATCGDGDLDPGEDCDNGIAWGEQNACGEVMVDVGGVPHRVLAGQGMACADKTYRPIFLSPTPEGSTDPNTFEMDGDKGGVRFLCLRLRDPELNDPDPEKNKRYYCAEGMVASGVTGYAIKKNTLSPRTFYVGQLSWGDDPQTPEVEGNTWTHHFELIHGGLGSITARVATPEGRALDLAWHLNPNDPLPGGAPDSSKFSQYLGMVALKTATNRNGVYVSPYTHSGIYGGAGHDDEKLNRCEPGYENRMDIASDGTLEQEILPSLWISQDYGDLGCKWVDDWNLASRARNPDPGVSGCSVFDVSGAAGPTMGINLHDTSPRRCPSWITCSPGSFCCVGDFDAGGTGTCVVKADGTLWCFGSQYYTHANPSRLGRSSIEAVAIRDGSRSLLRNIIQVSVGVYHSCARRGDGTVWCWGRNLSGMLGDGTTTDSYDAVQVVEQSGGQGLTGVEQVVVGDTHTCARKTDGSLWCWGAKYKGQLGDGTTTSRWGAVQVSLIVNFTSLDAGANHTCARRADGTAWCWGEGTYGKLGNGTITDRSIPVQVSGLDGVIDVSAGFRHSCARKIDGSSWCWGSNAQGRLGDGTTTSRLAPVQVSELTDVVEVRASRQHSCARRTDGTLWCWGDNGDGRLGDGTFTDRLTPVQVQTIADATRIETGNSHSCVRRTEGALWCWGANSLGQLGDGRLVLSPVPVEAVTVRCGCGDGVCDRYESPDTCRVDCGPPSCGDGRCTSGETTTSCALDCSDRALRFSLTDSTLAAGSRSTCARKTDGTLWCWGNNSTAQIGDGTRTKRPGPVQVGSLAETKQVAAGTSHTCATKNDGTLWCWGRNIFGELGLGNTSMQGRPKQVSGISAVVGVDAGDRHTCATRDDGTAWCWGDNDRGKLGVGSTADHWIPVQVSGLTSVAEIRASRTHSCARTAEGTLWCWGQNIRGALGDGTEVDRWVPVHISGLTNVAQIAMGYDHTCVRVQSGALWCWGRNNEGALGDGTTTFRNLPTQISALTDATWITAGFGHSCASKADGTLWCWGFNRYGQLGDGTTIDRWSPVQVSALTDVVEVSAGNDHTCARQTDGTLWCWGSNDYGALGDLTLLSSLLPVNLESRCGDGVCAFLEGAIATYACPADCGPRCGDKICDALVESCDSCATDCGACAVPSCGDAVCAPGETCDSCALDCGGCSGVTWSTETSGVGTSLQAVNFPVNAGVGYAVGAGGSILATDDGGTTWTALDSDTEQTLYAVDFIDDEVGYAVGDEGTALRTSDGGSSWHTLRTPTSWSLYGVRFFDAQIGFAVGFKGTILETSDGGESRTARDAGTTAGLSAVAFADAQTGVAVGEGGMIVRTTDGGTSWAAVTSGTTAHLHDVAFAPDSATAFAIGSGGTVLESTDGGASWAVVSSGVTSTLRAVTFPLDADHGTVVGDSGVLLRTDDGGASWTQEDTQTTETLLCTSFAGDWTMGVAVGASGAVVKRDPSWDPATLYDTEVASLAPPTLLPSADAMTRTLYAGNNNGHLYAIRAADRITRYKPVSLGDAVQGRGPVGALADESAPTLFVGTTGGIGYALDADPGAVRWQTDADAGTAGIQPLGDALIAAPVVSPSRNLAFFATRNVGNAENRILAFDAKTGACRFVVNGDCNGGTGSTELGQISGKPVHDFTAKRLYLTSTKIGNGKTVWAIDASDVGAGAVLWSRDLGHSDLSPAYADTSRTSLFIGTNAGEVYRLQAVDGQSCWSSAGSGCGDSRGSEQVFCTGTDALANNCKGGSAIVSGFFTVWSGPQAGNVAFVTADGHVRMIDANGALVWKTASPIAGASFPLLLPELAGGGKVYVGASDGKLHELSVDTGTETNTQQVGDGTAAVGTPTYDVYAKELYVGTTNGTLYHYSVPF